MSQPPNDAVVYRDALKPLIAEYEARRRRITERARPLDSSARAELSSERRREMEATEARLAVSPATREEIEAAEVVLDAYDKQVEDALSEVADVRERRLLDTQLRSGRRRNAIVLVAVLGAIVAGLLVWGRRVDQQKLRRRQDAFFARCHERPECASRGLCGAPPPAERGDSLVCYAVDNNDCRQSVACDERGECSADGGVCRVLTSRDCLGSRGCKERGECTADRGVCRVQSSADCYRSALCRVRGECSYEGGVCRVLGRADCAQSDACRERGECSPAGGACRALTTADCSRSPACRKRGECAPRDGRCVVSDEGCRATDNCTRLGQCAAVGPVCAPRAVNDCKQSEICKARGKCALGTGLPPQCQVSAEGCRASSNCRDEGYCTAFAGDCTVGGAADCRRTTLCAKHGWCTLRMSADTKVCGPSQGPMEGVR